MAGFTDGGLDVALTLLAALPALRRVACATEDVPRHSAPTYTREGQARACKSPVSSVESAHVKA